jgi:hypothetical protein
MLAGSKRKRVMSSNENAHAGGRPARGSGRLKRLRSASLRQQMCISDESEGETSSMEVDAPARWSASDGSDSEDEKVDEEVEEEDDSSEFYGFDRYPLKPNCSYSRRPPHQLCPASSTPPSPQRRACTAIYGSRFIF